MAGQISFEPPRGMRDFYPEDMVWRNKVFDAFRAAGAAAGFEPYDACVVESYELLARKAGEEVGEQIYHFHDKSDRHIALRAEMTPTFARMVAQRQGSLSFPIKWTTIAQCFRYERMTKGRKREHYQETLRLHPPSPSLPATDKRCLPSSAERTYWRRRRAYLKSMRQMRPRRCRIGCKVRTA